LKVRIELCVTALATISLLTGARPAAAQRSETTFELEPQEKFEACLSPYGQTPSAQVIVQRGGLNDTLILQVHHLIPHLAFDIFTIQNSNLLAEGTVDPNFKNFGLAWYQADVEADSNGEAEVSVKSILLDQIFGFDPAASLLPTHTFHVGLWFNKPADAQPCGFDPTKPTPFNGEQKAGPNAFISLPNPSTKLGPLCTNPQLVGGVYVCGTD